MSAGLDIFRKRQNVEWQQAFLDFYYNWKLPRHACEKHADQIILMRYRDEIEEIDEWWDSEIEQQRFL